MNTGDEKGKWIADEQNESSPTFSHVIDS